MMKTLGFLVMAALVVGGMGCEKHSGDNSDRSLQGTQWKLTGWSVSSLNPADFTITATFADGRISGRSGVNQYSGPYEIGPGSAFSVGPLVSTMMAGPEPAMRAESVYLTLLSQARSYALSGGRLTLYDAGGNESLIFAP